MSNGDNGLVDNGPYLVVWLHYLRYPSCGEYFGLSYKYIKSNLAIKSTDYLGRIICIYSQLYSPEINRVGLGTRTTPNLVDILQLCIYLL